MTYPFQDSIKRTDDEELGNAEINRNFEEEDLTILQEDGEENG